MSGEKRVYNQVTRVQFNSIKSGLRGIGFTPPSGDAAALRQSSKGGDLHIDVRYDEAAGTLSMQIRQIPTAETYASIYKRIEDVIARYRS